MITAAIILLAFFNFLLGLVTLLRNPERIENRAFFVYTTMIAIWMLASYFETYTTNPLIAGLLVKTDFAFGALLAASFIVFTATISTRNKKIYKYLIAVVIVELILAALVYANLVFTSEVVQGGIKITDSVLGEVVYDPLIIIPLLVGIGLLIRKRLRSRGLERQQASVMLFGLFVTVAWVGGAYIFVPMITSNVVTQTNLQHLAYSGFLVFSVTVSYAIVRHKLFDIRLVVARSVTYLLSIVTIGVAYGLLAFSLVDQLLFGSGTNASITQNTVNTMLAVILAFTFQPIRRFFEKVTDKIFYRDKYDAQLLINSVGRILSSEIELEKLTTRVVAEMKKQMHISHADIIVLQDDDDIFFDAGHLEKRVAIRRHDLVKLGNSVLVADNLLGGERKELMASYQRSIASPLRANKELIGYLFLGDKLSGDAYTSGDIEVIKIIVNELAVAVQNAKSFTEIQRFNETLQEKVKEATAKLRKANEDLKTLDQAKDEFISMASHQLRTPLTTAKGYVSMVLDGDYGKLSTKMKQPLDQALDSSNRMAGLINDLLNVSRMDAGKFFIDAVDVDLAVEVQGELNQLVNLAAAKQVKVTYHEPKQKIPLIKLDLDKTRQVIMNIVDNAIYYSAPPNGGGEVNVYLELKSDEAVFRVEDNGIGVPDNIKPKLFAKFFRAGNAQSARPDGTGLGLYLVKRVVEDQGGTIIFESKVGKGSTFGFRMPINNKIKVDKEAAKRLNSVHS